MAVQAKTMGNSGMGWIRRLYDWVVGWAEKRHSQTALFALALAESSFFPIPPDVLLVAMGVGKPRAALRFATICLAGSVLGGVLGYYLGWGAWSLVSEWFFTYVPNFTPALFELVTQKYQENAFMAIFVAGFTPVPYKIFTIAAGVAQIDLGLFIVASIFSRGMRFFLVGGALRIYGARIQTLIDRYFNLLTIAFTVLLIAGVLVIKMLK